MATTVQLCGTVHLGGGNASVETAVGGGAPFLLEGKADNVDFSKMVGQLLGSTFLHLPSDFPSITFDSAAVKITESNFDLRATSNVEWTNPFGILEGLTFKRLALAFTTAPSPKLVFTATVAYGSLPPLVGTLIFDQGTLVVAAASLNVPLSIGEFLSLSVGGIDWGQLLPITFSPQTPGGSARIYNNNTKKAFATYQPGFNIDQASIDVLGFAADVSLKVDDGVTVTGALQAPIDLGFLVLSDGAKGPSVTAMSPRSGTPSFSLQSAVEFLGVDFGSVNLAVQKAGNEYQLSGSVSAGGSAGPFTNPSFNFTWSSANGFAVPAWAPGFDASAFMKYLDLLNEMQGGDCGEFVQSLFNDAIKTKFDFQTEIAQRGLALVFTFSGSYTISVDGVGKVTFQMPTDLSVTLQPGEFSFEKLGEMLGKAIANAALGFVQSIRNDADQWVRFTAIVFAKGALAKVTELLACRDWPPPGDPGGGDRGGSGGPGLPSFPPIGGGSGPHGGSAGGGGTGSTGPSTITSFVFAKDALHATWNAVNGANFYASYLTNGQNVALEQKQSSTSATFPVLASWPARYYYLNVVAYIDQDHTGPWSPAATIFRLGAPSQPALTQNANVLTLQWAQSLDPPPFNGATGYEYIVEFPSGVVFQQGPVAGTSAPPMTLPADAPSGTYTATVRALGGESVIASQWTVPVTLTVTTGAIVSISNTSATSPIEARVTAPPSSVTKTIAPRTTALLDSSSITGFLVWKNRPATANTQLVDAFQVGIGSVGGELTLAYADIAAGRLPAGFTATARTGVLAGGQTFFSDVLTIPQMAETLKPFLTGPSDLAVLFVALYPCLTQTDLAGAALTAGFDVKGAAAALVDARQHFTSPNEITPASVAVALQQAWTAVKQPISQTDVALALLPAFAAIGRTLDATAVAKAVVAAFPIAIPITVARIEPLLQALEASPFTITDAAVGCHNAVPAVTPSILAQALRAVYQ